MVPVEAYAAGRTVSEMIGESLSRLGYAYLDGANTYVLDRLVLVGGSGRIIGNSAAVDMRACDVAFGLTGDAASVRGVRVVGNGGGTAISSEYAKGVEVSHNTFEDVGTAIYAVHSHGSLIAGNRINRWHAWGIHINASSRNTVTGNVLDDEGHGVMAGIEITGNFAASPSEYNLVTGNNVCARLGEALQLTNLGVRRNKITGNVFYTYDDPVQLVAGVKFINVGKGNALTNNTISTSGYGVFLSSGFQIVSRNDIEIRANNLGGPVGTGISVQPGSATRDQNLISDNTIDGGVDGIAAQIGNSHVISGNKIRNALAHGIHVNPVGESIPEGDVIVENIVLNSGVQDIFVQGEHTVERNVG